MLRKFGATENPNWHKDLQYLLFAYREVPQASRGFSPFELLYGRHVRGPFLFRESWSASSPGQTSVIPHLLDIRSRLAEYRDLVKTNMQTAQQQ